MNWPVIFNVLATALISGAAVALGAWTVNQKGGWVVPLVSGGMTVCTTLSAHLRESPLPAKQG